MAIWAFNSAVEPTNVEFVGRSFLDGISRFGWSYVITSNLRVLCKKPYIEMDSEERDCWARAQFLLNIKKGDWIVHINTPKWGYCITGQVEEEYNFEDETEVEDFRHFFKIDKSTIIQFNRNDENVHPIISRRLKLMGHYWRIYYQDEFFETVNNLKEGKKGKNIEGTIGLYYLKKELNPFLKEITKRIHNTHPEKKLEGLLATVFKNVPNVVNVTLNGSGWRSDKGADIIVKYQSGIGISNLQREETLVVQVKSYEGAHFDNTAINQIEEAIAVFNADCGLIITTGDSTEFIEKKIEEVSIKIKKPIGLLAGENVAKFILKYEKGLLMDV
jgi:hypothetical protein